jgi:hypothetical protein
MRRAHNKRLTRNSRALLREKPHLARNRLMHAQQVTGDDRRPLAIVLKHKDTGEQRIVHAARRLAPSAVSVHQYRPRGRNIDRRGPGQ